MISHRSRQFHKDLNELDPEILTINTDQYVAALEILELINSSGNYAQLPPELMNIIALYCSDPIGKLDCYGIVREIRNVGDRLIAVSDVLYYGIQTLGLRREWHPSTGQLLMFTNGDHYIEYNLGSVRPCKISYGGITVKYSYNAYGTTVDVTVKGLYNFSTLVTQGISYNPMQHLGRQSLTLDELIISLKDYVIPRRLDTNSLFPALFLENKVSPDDLRIITANDDPFLHQVWDSLIRGITTRVKTVDIPCANRYQRKLCYILGRCINCGTEKYGDTYAVGSYPCNARCDAYPYPGDIINLACDFDEIKFKFKVPKCSTPCRKNVDYFGYVDYPGHWIYRYIKKGVRFTFTILTNIKV